MQVKEKNMRNLSLVCLANSFIVRTYKIHWTLKQDIIIQIHPGCLCLVFLICGYIQYFTKNHYVSSITFI